MAGEHKEALLSAEKIEHEPGQNLKGKRLLVLLVCASCLLAWACASGTVTPHVAQVDAAMQFNTKTHTRSSVDSPKYYWPSARGNAGSYSLSPYPAQFDLKEPSWTWSYNCCSGCTWCTAMVGVVLDEHKCIYLTATDGIRKFSPTGQLLWRAQRKNNEETHKVAALLDGAVHAISVTGRAYALSMQTGQELWSTKIARQSIGNEGQVAAQHGVAIHPALPGRSSIPPANSKLYGLNSTDGRILWKYKPDVRVWNFGATFPGDGTFIYQTLDGQVHRNFVNNGTLMWKAGGIPLSWTDGQTNLGSNGVVYAVAGTGFWRLDWPNPQEQTGCLSAHRLSDGRLLWRRYLTKTPNSIPAVGMLAGQTKLSVVIPVGINDMKNHRIDVLAFDAETGEDQWVFKGPVQLDRWSPSDANPAAKAQRTFNKVRPIMLPNCWGTPVIDGRGAVFVGGITGHIFRLMDLNGDGKVAGHGEVANMTTDADFVGSSAPAIAPGLFAIGNTHKLFVWNDF